MSESTDQKVKGLRDEIAQLERTPGQKQIKVDFYEKLLQLAENEYDMDFKKSCISKRSGGSGRTEK